MVAKLQSWWQKIKQHPFIAAGIIVGFLTTFLLVAYMFNWDWTGFTGGVSTITTTSVPHGTTTAKELHPGKSLWDWLQLLGIIAIPVAVAWFISQQSRDLQIMAENQHETALQAFIDKIPDVKLLQAGLAGTKEQIILNARTFVLLPSLDANRKRTLLNFLYKLELVYRNDYQVGRGYPIIKLSSADLSGANLAELDLTMADLSGANLRNADLRNTNLTGTNLSGADLSGADLSEADLNGATITPEQLDKAKSLKGATRPDGSKPP